MAEKVEQENEKEYLIMVHKLGYITCYCGFTGDAHHCKVEKGKLKFDYCVDPQCGSCYEEMNWNLQRYKRKNGYTVCGHCESKIGGENICGDCFCQRCYEFHNDCKCCNFCGFQSDAQCTCYDSDSKSNNEQ